MHYKHYLRCYKTFIIIYPRQALYNFQLSFQIDNAAGTMKMRKYSDSASQRKKSWAIGVLAYSTTKQGIFLLSCGLTSGLLWFIDVQIWFVEAMCLLMPLEKFRNVSSEELEKSILGELEQG